MFDFPYAAADAHWLRCYKAIGGWPPGPAPGQTRIVQT